MKVRVQPEELKVGIEATLYCDAASSNPPATLSWWRDGIPVQGQKSLNLTSFMHDRLNNKVQKQYVHILDFINSNILFRSPDAAKKRPPWWYSINYRIKNEHHKGFKRSCLYLPSNERSTAKKRP